ncbi:hypothetical protein H6F42_15930 [Pseudanabaena sp. FACHB-1998]|uniref:hypothetical protein n=1 Tax=Pseudanabaena sp. FACHB-1998 TaxID=2692858 RepID=UPI0016813929|nr:hypothetical protein [Pseudanabaena sp. FACHB-1998]MBD2178409.1 hypothetical protein [Pseudanabaena sp. FACHB-1998]
MLVATPVSALSNAVPFTRPPYSPINIPNSGSLLKGLSGLALIIGAVDLIGELGAKKWRDDLLSKNTGNRSSPEAPSQDNFYGSKANQSYSVAGEVSTDKVNWSEARSLTSLLGRITTLGVVGDNQFEVGNEQGDYSKFNIGAFGYGYIRSVYLRELNGNRAFPDNQVAKGNSGLALGAEPLFSQGLANPSTPLSPFATNPIKDLDNRKSKNKDLGAPILDKGGRLESGPTGNPSKGASALKSPIPFKTEEEQKKQSPPEKSKEEQKKREEEQKKLLDDLKRDNSSIIQELVRIGAISAAINLNTTPEAQRNNSKNGACDALNSPSCTKGVEDRIKDPINGKVDNVASKVAATASTLDLLKDVADNSFKFISRIYNNQFVHSSLSFMTNIAVIHNAAMLSRDVAETLGTVVDNSVNLSGQKLKDAEGNDIGFTSWIGNNIRGLIIQLIGADRYVQLALQWQKASTIYHSSMAVVNTTQSMIDPLASAVEYGMENVSKIGNGLREDGVVSENNYPAMDETIRARRVNRFERLNDTLEGAENISSNLSSITSSAVSVKEDYKQLREDQKQLRDQASAFNNADEQARAEIKASLPTGITPIILTPAPEEETS